MSRRNTSDMGFVITVLFVTIVLIMAYVVYDDGSPSQSTETTTSMARTISSTHETRRARTEEVETPSRSGNREDPLEAALQYHEHVKKLPTLIPPPPPPPPPTPTPVPSQEPIQSEVSTSNDGLNWAALAECESGGSPTIVSSNGLWYGLYQFTLGTWASVGGTGLPTDASAEEQTARAQTLYERSGDGPWPNCGYHLYD